MFGDFILARTVQATASTKYLTHISTSSQIINFASRMLEASFESIEIMQTLSEKQGVGILITELALIPLSKSHVGTADVAPAINFCRRNFRTD